MKYLPYIFLTTILICGGLGLYVKGANALERTISIDEVNYVSLQQMAKKYNLAVQQENGSVKLVGESINLTVPTTTNIFTLNGANFIAQTTSKVRDGETWITAKDWAGLFDLKLTHYDRVSEMSPASSEPVTNEAEIDDHTYRLTAKWGEPSPEGIRKHGNITEVTTPVIDFPIYEEDHSNIVLESENKVQDPWQK